jgi:Ca-activated chloride channel family protein
MTFANPRILWLLGVFPPLLLVFFWWAWRRRQELIAQFIQARLLPGLTVGISDTRVKFRLAFLLLAVICLILALARPQWGFDWEPTRQRGLDIVVAIDTSKSMLAEDIAPNRLVRAKLAALDIMQQARSDRLGLVAFAGSAFLQCPLTIDDAVFRQSVDALDVNIIPQGGTALAEAIEKALAAFSEADSFKALVLLTDGEDHDSGAVAAAKKAAAAGLQIFTVGIGTANGELLQVKDVNGRSDYIRDEDGNVVKSHLNEALLMDIAKQTDHGVYYRLQGAKTIEMLYTQNLSKLPKSEHEEKLVRRYHERYHWPLAFAFLFLAAEMLFPERRRESKPRSIVASKTLNTATALCFLLLLPAWTRGSTASALRDYKDGKYSDALKQYEKMLQNRKDDPRLHFNAGAAAYRGKNFEQAAKEFDAALAAPDLKLQELSYYNRGNARFWLGDQIQDPSKKTETWTGAMKDFESSLKLNPQDSDAKFNYQFVKKKLEELKQQQQQQQQQNKNDQKQDQNQDQQQQQQQSQNQDSKDQSKKEQQSNQSENKEGQEKQQSQQDKKQQEQQKEEQKKQQAQQQQAKDQQTNNAAAKPQEPKDEKGNDEGEAAAVPGQMTPEQARQLLDAQKDEEHLLPVQPEKKPIDRTRRFKDW